jgi:hypothetical protein
VVGTGGSAWATYRVSKCGAQSQLDLQRARMQQVEGDDIVFEEG